VVVVSTFYLLPPRPLVADQFASYLANLFPGLDWRSTSRSELADLLTTAIARHPDVYVVHREDLPPGEDPARALIDEFGAEPGDEVVEVRPGIRSGEMTVRRWRLAGLPVLAQVAFPDQYY
jgi:hypothetical protein